MIKAVFLDMDDTLIAIQPLFERAESLLTAYLGAFGITADETHSIMMQKDKEVYSQHGFTRHAMAAAYELTILHFMPDADEEMISAVRGFAETIYTTVPDIKPGVTETVDLLTKNYPVYIVTQGDQSVQAGRLAQLPFLEKMTDIFIVDKKNEQLYTAVVKRAGFKPEEVVMIGDSLRSDVIPSVAAGLHAVLIEAENSQLHETTWHGAAHLPAERACSFSSLLEAAKHLVKNGTLPTAPKPSAPSPK